MTDDTTPNSPAFVDGFRTHRLEAVQRAIQEGRLDAMEWGARLPHFRKAMLVRMPDPAQDIVIEHRVMMGVPEYRLHAAGALAGITREPQDKVNHVRMTINDMHDTFDCFYREHPDAPSDYLSASHANDEESAMTAISPFEQTSHGVQDPRILLQMFEAFTGTDGGPGKGSNKSR